MENYILTVEQVTALYEYVEEMLEENIPADPV